MISTLQIIQFKILCDLVNRVIAENTNNKPIALINTHSGKESILQNHTFKIQIKTAESIIKIFNKDFDSNNFMNLSAKTVIITEIIAIKNIVSTVQLVTGL